LRWIGELLDEVLLAACCHVSHLLISSFIAAVAVLLFIDVFRFFAAVCRLSLIDVSILSDVSEFDVMRSNRRLSKSRFANRVR
jgi:hypothetical protein